MLKQGDRVLAKYTQNEPDIVGILEWCPSGPGDCWHIRDDEGYEYAINPYCSELVWIRTKHPKEER